MIRILVGTSNESKVSFFRQLLEGLDVEIVSASELRVPAPDETGTTPLENAVIKAEYYGRFAPYVIAADSGLFFASLSQDDPLQPGLHIRSPEGSFLDDEAMITFYAGRIHQLGGHVCAYYLDGTALCTPDGTYTFLPTTDELLATAFTMLDTPVAARRKGWPLDSLCYDQQGLSFLDESRTGNSQNQWAYTPRLRQFLISALNLKPQKADKEDM